MADTGWLYPSSVVNDTGIGTLAWGNPGYAVSDNNQYTTFTPFMFSQISNYLKATGFDTSAVEGATVDGIEVGIARKWDGVFNCQDNVVKLVRSSGVLGTQNKAATSTNWPSTEQLKTYGNGTDLWNESWTYSDLTAGFGVVLAITGPDFRYQAYVDYMCIKIYYTAGASAPQTPPPIVVVPQIIMVRQQGISPLQAQ